MTSIRSLTMYSRTLIRNRNGMLSRTPQTIPRIITILSSSSPRPFSTTPHNLAETSSSSTTENPHAQKAAQHDRQKMNVEPNEYSKSMTDSETAQQDKAAFGQNNPDPQDAKKKAGEGKDVNPLDASPANPEISQHTSEVGSGAGEKVKRN